MTHILLALAALFLALPAAAQTTADEAPFTDYTAQFDAFATETADMPMDRRVALFRERFGALWPGFYAPRGSSEERYNARIARALTAYPGIRDKFLAVSAAFARDYATAEERFGSFFPDFRMTMPVYLVHSLGEMDGGTREMGGQTVLAFGADMIAMIHDAETVGPLFDHELFHTWHQQYFECEPVQLWCAAWAEGLAVYVAERMNPGASDRQLLLTIPVPLREAVDPQLDAAMCLLRDKMDSEDEADYAAFFQFGGDGDPFPRRFGYYLGYRIARHLGADRDLPALARMTSEQVRPLMESAIAEIAHCDDTTRS